MGFLLLDYQDPTDGQRKDLGFWALGLVTKRTEQLDVSAVPVSADTGAVLIEDNGERAGVKAAPISVRVLAPVELRRPSGVRPPWQPVAGRRSDNLTGTRYSLSVMCQRNHEAECSIPS